MSEPLEARLEARDKQGELEVRRPKAKSRSLGGARDDQFFGAGIPCGCHKIISSHRKSACTAGQASL
jgi:hypothetical protein